MYIYIYNILCCVFSIVQEEGNGQEVRKGIMKGKNKFNSGEMRKMK